MILSRRQRSHLQCVSRILAAEYQGPGGSDMRRERRRSTHTSHPRPPDHRSMLGPHAHAWAPPQRLESRCWHLNRDFSFTLQTTETHLHILLVYPMGSIHPLIFCFIRLRNSYPYFFLGGGMWYEMSLLTQLFTFCEREPKDLRRSVGPKLKLLTRLSCVPVTVLGAGESPFKNLWDGWRGQSRAPAPKLTCALQRLRCPWPHHGGVAVPSTPSLCSWGNSPIGGTGGGLGHSQTGH